MHISSGILRIFLDSNIYFEMEIGMIPTYVVYRFIICLPFFNYKFNVSRWFQVFFFSWYLVVLVQLPNWRKIWPYVVANSKYNILPLHISNYRIQRLHLFRSICLRMLINLDSRFFFNPSTQRSTIIQRDNVFIDMYQGVLNIKSIVRCAYVRCIPDEI